MIAGVSSGGKMMRLCTVGEIPESRGLAWATIPLEIILMDSTVFLKLAFKLEQSIKYFLIY
jgi:hypothetical protein